MGISTKHRNEVEQPANKQNRPMLFWIVIFKYLRAIASKEMRQSSILNESVNALIHFTSTGC
jgi:hypothetical protein